MMVVSCNWFKQLYIAFNAYSTDENWWFKTENEFIFCLINLPLCYVNHLLSTLPPFWIFFSPLFPTILFNQIIHYITLQNTDLFCYLSLSFLKKWPPQASSANFASTSTMMYVVVLVALQFTHVAWDQKIESIENFAYRFLSSFLTKPQRGKWVMKQQLGPLP